MNKLEIFNHPDFGNIRTTVVNDEPWFAGKDVAEALGYSDPLKAIRVHVDEDDKGVDEMATPGGNQSVIIINESGVYALVFGSKLPSAKKFKHWVTSEVLPMIRKTRGYQIPTDPMSALKLMFEVQKTDNQRINDLEGRVSNLAENAPLTPSEYGYLNNLIASRVREVKQVHQMNLNKRQNSYLYKAIGRDVKQVANVQVRSQIRSRDFDKVAEFVKEWEPSKAVMVVIQDLV
jgi:prophage antirepressor-like protein|nr:MAG TPA: repressor domain protein [Caudoviricetes sp.]